MKLLLVHDSHPEINAVGKVRNVEQMDASTIGASVRELLITREGILKMRDRFNVVLWSACGECGKRDDSLRVIRVCGNGGGVGGKLVTMCAECRQTIYRGLWAYAVKPSSTRNHKVPQ